MTTKNDLIYMITYMQHTCTCNILNRTSSVNQFFSYLFQKLIQHSYSYEGIFPLHSPFSRTNVHSGRLTVTVLRGFESLEGRPGLTPGRVGEVVAGPVDGAVVLLLFAARRRGGARAGYDGVPHAELLQTEPCLLGGQTQPGIRRIKKD